MKCTTSAHSVQSVFILIRLSNCCWDKWEFHPCPKCADDCSLLCLIPSLHLWFGTKLWWLLSVLNYDDYVHTFFITHKKFLNLVTYSILMECKVLSSYWFKSKRSLVGNCAGLWESVTISVIHNHCQGLNDPLWNKVAIIGSLLSDTTVGKLHSQWRH